MTYFLSLAELGFSEDWEKHALSIGMGLKMEKGQMERVMYEDG